MNICHIARSAVAPYAGAWIETAEIKIANKLDIVAPYAGAWIETFRRRPFAFSLPSHPMRVRGLKLKIGQQFLNPERRTLCGCVD